MTESGCLLKDEFARCCLQIIDRSKQLNDSFQILSHQNFKDDIYLVKKQVRRIPSNKLKNDGNVVDEVLSDLNQDLVEVVDDAAVESDQSIELVQFEYHILYSESYNVPVCYFTAYKNDGFLLKLEEIWNLVSKDHKHALKEKWSFITQQEHPYLLTPFFQLHPCHTSAMMKVLHAHSSKYSMSSFGDTEK